MSKLHATVVYKLKLYRVFGLTLRLCIKKSLTTSTTLDCLIAYLSINSLARAGPYSDETVIPPCNYDTRRIGMVLSRVHKTGVRKHFGKTGHHALGVPSPVKIINLHWLYNWKYGHQKQRAFAIPEPFSVSVLH